MRIHSLRISPLQMPAFKPCLAAAAFGIFCLSASAADDKASGTLTVNGVKTPVAHVYAREVPGFFDKSKKDVEIILADMPLDAQAQKDPIARSKLAASGKLHAFEMILNAEGKPISTSWRHSGFKEAAPSGLSTSDVFTAKPADRQTIDASYKSASPHKFFGNSFDFDVAFRVAVAK